MSEKPYLSVIIPAYNEAKRLPLTLIDIDKHLEKAMFSYEIVVVDNNSNDSTKEIADRFAVIIKNMKVLECKTRGKGAAVKKGMLESNGKIKLFTDADNSTSITHLFNMRHYFKEGFGVVIGSRKVKGAKMSPPQSWSKRILGSFGNVFIQFMLLKKIKDTQCGFKAFTEEAADKIFKLVTVNGWGFDVEVLTIAKKLKFKIKEMPVIWVNNVFTHVKLSSYLSVLLEVIRIKIKLMVGKYDKF